MNKLVLVSCLAWAASAWAGDDPRPIPAVRLRGLFTYEQVHEKTCHKVSAKLVARWDKGFFCMPNSADAVGGGGHPYVAKCAAQNGKQAFLVFRTRADCLAAHDAQPANASEPAE
jgi:hypothetical protein